LSLLRLNHQRSEYNKRRRRRNAFKEYKKRIERIRFKSVLKVDDERKEREELNIDLRTQEHKTERKRETGAQDKSQ